jgi:hypothetical protein
MDNSNQIQELYMSTNHNFEAEPEPQVEYIPNAADEACKEALGTNGGPSEVSLRAIDPILWLRGKIAMKRGLYAGEVSDEELIHVIKTTKGTRWQLLTDEEISQNFFG